MSKLSVKTKNNSSPQGKPRVYFSCHPADFERYFETICEDIFATQDCAIYYESDWETETDEEELKLNLSDMQMFVIPVTTIFLLEENRAKSFEYGFAMEQHIPVIPVAMEGGLEKLFAEKLNSIGSGYGNVQYLDRTSTDSSQISYAEKFAGRLSSILIGNELAERVRAAFDAYIFLSYRKKDREKAKELMKKIHKVPFCRDIAIWYDEYLVAGEAWNEQIAEALDKCRIVTLLVTPSILEPGNFVMEHEYPDAVAIGKDIFPAEVISTDRDVLFSCFDGISDPFDGTDDAVLRKMFQQIALLENDSDPEHNYLIGLAYLNAIDVERDYERALELITYAADQGFAAAMKKLSDMYKHGEGVERNEDTSFFWLLRYAEALAEEDKHGLEYLSVLEECGKEYRSQKKHKEAIGIYETMVTRCEESLRRDDSVKIRIILSNAYIGLGRLCDEGPKKEQFFERAVSVLQQALSDRRDVEIRRALMRIYDSARLVFFKVCLSDRDAKEKVKNYRMKALILAEEVAKETEEFADLNFLERLHLDYGTDCVTIDEEEARYHFHKSIEISMKIYEQYGIKDASERLGMAYNSMGCSFERDNMFDEARVCYLKSIEWYDLYLKRHPYMSVISILVKMLYKKLADLEKKQ